MENIPTTPKRKLLHTRQIIAEGFKRDDDLWDLQASLSDVKTTPFPNIYRGKNSGGYIPAGEPLHGMRLTVTVDINLIIRAVDVQMSFTPYQICPEIAKTYQQAIGLKITSGFMRKINELFKSVNGCAHVTELWSTIGTLAYQTLFPEFARRDFDNAAKGLAGACHVHSTEDRTLKNIHAHIPAKD